MELLVKGILVKPVPKYVTYLALRQIWFNFREHFVATIYEGKHIKKEGIRNARTGLGLAGLVFAFCFLF